MYPPIIGNAMRRIFFRRRIQDRSWQALTEETLRAKARFDAEWHGLTEAQVMTPVRRRAEIASVADMLAHLSAVNIEMERFFDNFATGKTQGQILTLESLLPGAAGRSFSELRDEYDGTWQALERRLTESDRSDDPATQAHFFFGPMTAREWLFLIGFHFGYHTRQIRAFRAKMR